MTAFSAAVAQRFGLQAVLPTAQLAMMQVEVVTTNRDPAVLHTLAVTLMLLDRSGLAAEARSLILVHLVQVPEIWTGALAVFDGRYATLAPPATPPVHLDIVELKEVGDPVRAGRHPIISTILHLSEVYRVCKEALSGNGNVPEV
jgi:hypothetical protein